MAIGRITDQSMVAEIAITTERVGIGEAAIKALTD